MAVDWWLAIAALGALLVPLGVACWWLLRSAPPQPDDAGVAPTVVASSAKPPRSRTGAQ